MWSLQTSVDSWEDRQAHLFSSLDGSLGIAAIGAILILVNNGCRHIPHSMIEHVHDRQEADG